MNGRLPKLLLTLIGLAALGALLAALLPALLGALPSQVRGRLPEEVLRAITTPLPTALPLPLATAGAPLPSLAELLPVATPLPTNIPPTQAATVATAAAQPPTPTATSPPTATAVPSATPLPGRVLISGLTVVPQKFNNCGPANLSVVLDYWGAPDTQSDIAAAIKPHYDDRNVSPEELVAYVREHTALEAAVYRGGSIDLLRRLLAAGFPVIVEKGYEPNDWQGWMGHYLTLNGYEDRPGQFVGLDTFLGPWDSSGRPISYDDLAAYWTHFNNTFLVVYHPSQGEDLAALLGPDYLDAERMWQNAAAAAETAVAARPDDAFAWFNLGASLTELALRQDEPALYEAAATAFDRARVSGLPPRMLWYQFQPYEAYLGGGRADEALALATAVMEGGGGWHIEEAHYYQARAYQAAGDADRARLALRNALQIRPGYTAAQALLETLGN